MLDNTTAEDPLLGSLVSALTQRASEVRAEPSLATRARVQSISVVGSLARRDFVPGGSDVDLMFVHRWGDRPTEELMAQPDLRTCVRYFGDVLLSLAGDTGRQKPFLVDCHFVDLDRQQQQPYWADPARFRPEYTARNAYLWLYAFDLALHPESCTRSICEVD